MKKIAALLIFFILITFSGRAEGFDAYLNLNPEMRACLLGVLGEHALERLKSGNVPEDGRKLRKADEVYARCVIKVDQGIPAGVDYYDGPFFDAMSQIDETVDMEDAIDAVRKAGVGKLALFARSRKSLGQNEKAVLKIAKGNSDLIVLGAPKYFMHGRDLGGDYVAATLEGVAGQGYRFVGEILYTHADKKSGKSYSSGERYTDPPLPGTHELMDRLADSKIPIMTHFEVYEPERDFPRFHKLYDEWPDQIFIIPHMAFGSAEQCGEFLGRHPNVYMTISKKTVAMDNFQDSDKFELTGSPMLEGMELKPEWRDLMIKYQDRLLAATDCHKKARWDDYPAQVFLQRVVLGQLPREAAEKIAFRNAEEVYGVRGGSK